MTVPSPCVRNCCLDGDDVCIGCGRTVEEIIRWGDAEEQEKKRILSLSKERRKKREKRL